MIRLSEKIVDDIKQRIMSGEYQTGDRLLAELDLARQHDVSRAVIRESLRNLETLGLVRIKKGPGGGIFVSHSYHKPISDSLRGLVEGGQVTEENIFDIRLLIETYATEKAAMNAGPNDIARLRSLLAVPESKRTNSQWLQANRSKFHLGLASASKNPVLEVLMKGLISLLRKYFKDFHVLEFELESLESHQKILDAVENKDPQTARALMRTYILGMRDYINRMNQETVNG